MFYIDMNFIIAIFLLYGTTGSTGQPRPLSSEEAQYLGLPQRRYSLRVKSSPKFEYQFKLIPYDGRIPEGWIRQIDQMNTNHLSLNDRFEDPRLRKVKQKDGRYNKEPRLDNPRSNQKTHLKIDEIDPNDLSYLKDRFEDPRLRKVKQKDGRYNKEPRLDNPRSNQKTHLKIDEIDPNDLSYLKDRFKDPRLRKVKQQTKEELLYKMVPIGPRNDDIAPIKGQSELITGVEADLLAKAFRQQEEKTPVEEPPIIVLNATRPPGPLPSNRLPKKEAAIQKDWLQPGKFDEGKFPVNIFNNTSKWVYDKLPVPNNTKWGYDRPKDVHNTRPDVPSKWVYDRPSVELPNSTHSSKWVYEKPVSILNSVRPKKWNARPHKPWKLPVPKILYKFQPVKVKIVNVYV